MSTGRPTNTGTQAPAPTTFIQLRAQFEAKYREYLDAARAVTVAANPTDQQLERLRRLNREVFSLLERLIQSATDSQRTAMERVNESLSVTLARIERQYNDLTVKSDRAETLRRIREFEELKADNSVGTYMIALLVFAVLVLIIMVFSAYRASAANAMAATSPATMEPLT